MERTKKDTKASRTVKPLTKEETAKINRCSEFAKLLVGYEPDGTSLGQLLRYSAAYRLARRLRRAELADELKHLREDVLR